MADEVASLKVLITGDAAQLQSAITQTEAALMRLENSEKKNAAAGATAVASNTKARKENTSAVDENMRATKESSDSVNKNTESLSKNTSESKKNAKQQEETIKKLKATGQGYKDLGDGIDTVTKPLQVGAAVMAAGGVAAVKFAMDYETAFTGVKKTVDGTDAELNQLSDDIREMAMRIPVSAAELANLAAIGGQLGVKVNDIEKFTETIAAMGVATNLSGEEGASALARIINVTGESMDNVDRIGSSIVALGNNSATTEAEIAEMAVRMGKFGNTVGINAQQVLGYSAALSSLGVEAQAGGSAIGRTWLSIAEAVSSGGKSLQAYAKYAGVSAAEFKKQWSTDASGTFAKVIKGLSQSKDLVASLNELGINNTIDQQSVMALANGYDMLANSLELSSDAYEENTALTKEAEAAYATTANQLKIAGNNLVDAAMDIGEMLLPSIVDATDGVKNFAHYLANMDDGLKQGIITTGKWVIGLGLGSKALVGTVKGVGNVAEAVGKIKTATAAGGVLAKFGPALTTIGTAAPWAVAGIAAVGTAVWAGKKAYDAWYDSQYRFTKDLEKGNEAIAENTERVDNLRVAQQQLENLDLIINSPKSSKDAVENAKTKLQSIADMLEEEYGLKINVDAGNLPEVVEQIEQVIAYKTEEEWNKAMVNVNDQIVGLVEDRNTADGKSAKIEQWRAEATAAQELYIQYDNLHTKLDTLHSSYQSGMTDQQSYADGLRDLAREVGLSDEEIKLYGDNVTTLYEAVAMRLNDKKFNADAARNMHADEITAYDDSVKQLKESAEKTADQLLSLIATAEEMGKADDIPQMIEQMNLALETGGVQASEYAKRLTESLTGAKVEDVIGDSKKLSAWIDQYVDSAQKLGLTQEEIALTVAQFATGCTDAEKAAENLPKILKTLQSLSEASGLETTAEQLTAVARSMGLIPENKQIQINADGSYAVAELDEVKEAENSLEDGVTVKAKSDTEEAKKDIEKLDEEEINPRLKIDLDEPRKQIATLNGEKITIKATLDFTTQKKARGTQDFDGGLAMINDQRGVADPRELVEVDGQGYIFEGKDVVLPLPEHAKVYTAAQTKAIMQGKGIPHYAKGKKNEAFENAKKDWTHYTKVNDVSATEELEHWNQLLKKFAKDAEAVKEIQEEIFATTKQLWSEDLDAMGYALDMGEISTQEYYDRLKQYRDEHFQEGSEEYKKTTLELKNLSSDMFQERLDDSYDWLAHEEKYNNLSVEDYIAGLDRMKAYTEEALQNGVISYEEYLEIIGDLTDKRVDKTKEAIDDIAKDIDKAIGAWEDSADWYYRQSEVFGWGFGGSGDTKVDFFGRKVAEYQRQLDEGELNPEQYAEIQRKRDEALLEQYQAQEEALNEILDEQKEAISRMESEYARQVSALRESWSVSDRAESMEELQEQLRIYSGAATLEGKEEYERIQEELKNLQREQAVYEIEQEQAANIAKLEEEYGRYAKEQSELLRASISSQVDMTTFTDSVNTSTNDILGRIDTVVKAIETLENFTKSVTVNQTFHNNITDPLSAEALVSTAGRLASRYGGGY